MREIWNRIENWLSINAPQVFQALEKGATDIEIQKAEDKFEVIFPDDFTFNNSFPVASLFNIRSS